MIIDSLRSGGKERRLIELLKGFTQYNDINCQLVLLSNEVHYNEVRNLNVKIYFFERRWKKDPTIYLKLYRICKIYKPHIIHSWGSMPSVYSFPIAKLLKIKFINAMITSAPENLKILSKIWIRSKLTFPSSDIILSNSNAGIKSYNAPKSKSYCIHNGFDFSRLEVLEDKNTIKAKFGINTEKVVGKVASFSDNKDYRTYISAAQMVLLKRDDVSFLAIGDGKNLEKCKIMTKLKFQDKIKFLGKQEDVESIINVFDIGVLTTNQKVHGEGISNAIMEYMALRKPVIATEGGGTKELVIDNSTGYLIKSESAEDLARKILYLLEHHETAKRMGIEGKRRIQTDFSLEKMTNSYMRLYKRLLN